MDHWSEVRGLSELLSPSLVIDRGLVARNLATMVEMARGPARLRPHVKTHKMPAVVRMLEALGVDKHKCATLAEAEMLARAGASDVLLAFPVVGPNVGRLARLARLFPAVRFRTLADDHDAAGALSAGMDGLERPLGVLVDLEVGMGRTGILPGDGAFDLCTLIGRLPNLAFDGLHAYDGHLRAADPAERARLASPGIEQTLALRDRLRAAGIATPRLVMGGTPTFPIHAASEEPGVECSPGTCVFHDASYAEKFPDLPFSPAAVVFSRVISRPRPGRITLDLGHKAVAADPVGPRVRLLDVPDATLGGQSEEHLVVDTPAAGHFPPGTVVLAIPFHICPTCALHRRAYVVENGQIVDEWEVAARDRVLTV